MDTAFCIAPSRHGGDVLWMVDQGSGGKPSPTEVARRFSGAWDMLIVATEGIGSPHVHRTTLRLVPTDSAARITCPIGPCRGSFSYPAAGQFLIGEARFDSAAAVRHRMREARDADVGYNRELGTVTISAGPPMFDAGVFYSVSIFSDTAFAGRWEDGSPALGGVQRGDVTTYERATGYFCARRISP